MSDLRQIDYEYTQLFPNVLQECNCTLLISTYQANKLLIVRLRNGVLELGARNFEQPMGIAVHPERIAIGTRREIRVMERRAAGLTSLALGALPQPCLHETNAHVTGRIRGHELGWGADGLWIVNTSFSCLCQLQPNYSFVPRWQPSFITQLADQDRCHLNGMALLNGYPKYVTALARSDEPEGWRACRGTSGILIDTANGEIITKGLAMPHSPRCYEGAIWLLNSGCGQFGMVDPLDGQFRVVNESPGYLRGLSFHQHYAFIGLSKIRESSIFSGLPVSSKHDELFCGIGVIDMRTGSTVAVLKFQSGVSEIFSVEALPGSSFVELSAEMNGEVENEIWVLP